MRSLWLASTALLITTGIACAQSTQTASPAPTGAVTAPQVTPSGAPGNMAPAPSGNSMSAMSSSATSGTSSTPSPAPNGAASAPDVNSGATPGTAPGKMSTASNGMASTETDGATPGPMYSHHHHWSSATTLPADASASTYLHIAKSAIWHHNVALADDALSHAETQLLDRSVPQGQVMADNSPSIQSIESARKALHAGNYSQASADTKQAATAVSGM
jgi:hypothetical protein